MFSNPFSLSPIRMITDGCGYNGADRATLNGADLTLHGFPALNMTTFHEARKAHVYARRQILEVQANHPNRADNSTDLGGGNTPLSIYISDLRNVQNRGLTEAECDCLGFSDESKLYFAHQSGVTIGLLVHEHKDNGVRLNLAPQVLNKEQILPFGRQVCLDPCNQGNQWVLGRLVNAAQRQCHTWSTVRQGGILGLVGLGALLGLRKVAFNWKSGVAGVALGVTWWAARSQHQWYAEMAGFTGAVSVYNGEVNNRAPANEHLNELDDAWAHQAFDNWRPRSTSGAKGSALTFSDSITEHKEQQNGGSHFDPPGAA